MQHYEKLGSFYLGKRFDPKQNSTTEDLLLYDAKDLTTHAMCVGMTGSGKTGLCVSLLEEAAMDDIPALMIDPKGDLGNLLLTFPDLDAASFRPWVDESEAARKGFSVDEYAADRAALWKKGLGTWGQDAARIAALREKADFSIYTPGSNAGLPLTILKSFAAPPPVLRDDTDAMQDRVQASVSGLLAMLGIDADPIQSREHILLSNILHRAWNEGRDMDLPSLIREIQAPPFDKLGVFDLESFYPAKERFSLAMRLNNMLASPGFESWMQGEPLDIQRLLWTPEGKPRMTVLSIAHLSESERMFFVTVLLNEIIAWMRSQPGTSSLRALLYMDEIFGYFPPTANPPTKKPMLTLLKQARAYGLGCVLATQNPVDLDYKGLSNTGTWFIGRLQTERDKMRVLDGLEGASGEHGQAFDRAAMEATLAGLGNRVFLMNNVHEDGPVLFQTRWAMSYLRGPLTRSQIEILMADKKAAPPPPPPATPTGHPAPAAAPSVVPAAPAAPVPQAPATQAPALPPGIPSGHFPLKVFPTTSTRLVYRPLLLGSAKLHFVKSTAKVDDWLDVNIHAGLPEDRDPVDWGAASLLPGETPDLDSAPARGATFSAIPESATVPRNYSSWEKHLKDYLYQTYTLNLLTCKTLKAISKPEETEGDFKVRVRQVCKEHRDLALEKLKKKYAPKLRTLQERVRKAEEKIDIQEAQYKSAKMQTVVSIGTTLLGAFLGRKAMSVSTMSRAGTTMRRANRTTQEKGDISRAEEYFEVLNRQLEELEAQFSVETDELKLTFDPELLDFETIEIRPRKSDIRVDLLALAWSPWLVGPDGIAERAF